MFSRLVFFIFIFLVLLVSASDTLAMAEEGLSWSLRKSPHVESVTNSSSSDDSDELHIAVTARKTEISSKSEILFIDYNSMNLFRFNRLSEQCSVFDLEGIESNAIAKETVSRLAEFSVKESGEKEDIKGLHCVKKTVLSGAGMFRLKTFVPKILERYGQSFSEAVAEYFVCQKPEYWQMLLEFVKHRQVAFTAQPLLKRIDPLGLIEAVGGLPVQGWRKNSGVKVDFMLISDPETSTFMLRPPQACESISGTSNVMK